MNLPKRNSKDITPFPRLGLFRSKERSGFPKVQIEREGLGSVGFSFLEKEHLFYLNCQVIWILSKFCKFIGSPGHLRGSESRVLEWMLYLRQNEIFIICQALGAGLEQCGLPTPTPIQIPHSHGTFVLQGEDRHGEAWKLTMESSNMQVIGRLDKSKSGMVGRKACLGCAHRREGIEKWGHRLSSSFRI